ncbi:MAG: adenylate/guanylate cyclase domain-containing protein [Treponema sp.]|nr:adenylate/guanylate cyclase domain-containing protein [Treponema sp.]
MGEPENTLRSLQSGESMELVFKETEFDILERELITKASGAEVFAAVSAWIMKRLDPLFVLFYADEGKPSKKIKYFTHQGINPIPVDFYIDERRRAVVTENALFVHHSGCFSLPFGFTTAVTGLLFIGPPFHGVKSYSLAQKKLLIPVVRILGRTFLFLEAGTIRQEKNQLQYAFSRYVSPDVVQNIVDNPSVMHLGGEKQFLSVIFTDLRNFTLLSESMDPVVLVRVLNMYLNEMSQVIISLGGTIDKFEGDAIMAFFGAPRKMEDHAVRCCLAALRMKRMEAVLNDQLIREKLITAPLFTRIGINSGDMIVGNIGSMQRLDYTIIGNNVNIASRIENVNKRYGSSILMSGQTFKLVKDCFDCQYLDTAYLKGVREPVPLYELKGERPDKIPLYTNCLANQTIDRPVQADDSDVAELEEL